MRVYMSPIHVCQIGAVSTDLTATVLLLLLLLLLLLRLLQVNASGRHD